MLLKQLVKKVNEAMNIRTKALRLGSKFELGRLPHRWLLYFRTVTIRTRTWWVEPQAGKGLKILAYLV